MNAPKTLSQVASADRWGSLTGRQYEYQHEQAAFSALEMLAKGDWRCVYCEWHEDYVVEAGEQPTTCYLFHQVKSKTLSQGPWSFRDLFGVAAPKAGAKTSRKPLRASDDAIFARLLEHDRTFGSHCGSFMFVTNTGVHPTVSKLVDGVALTDGYATLAAEVAPLFQQLVRAYCIGPQAQLKSPEELFAFLRRFIVQTERGNLKPDAALNEISDRVFEYSEIELQFAERRQIARQLVQLMRDKATERIATFPIDEAGLRLRKGAVIAEVLGVLSLSHEGYQALRSGGGSDVVKTLSRLERFCRSRGFDLYLRQICGFKAKWDVWRTTHRHRLEDADHVVIVASARAILLSNKTLPDMIPLARQEATRLSGGLPAGTAIGGEELLGLVFSVAAGAETAL
jgi:hypothetical protein